MTQMGASIAQKQQGLLYGSTGEVSVGFFFIKLLKHLPISLEKGLSKK